MPFECEKCGACCRAANCEFLKGNLCGRYENRPLACNIDKLYDTLFYKHFTREEWYAANKIACIEMREKHET